MSTDLSPARDALKHCADCFYKKDGLCHHEKLQAGFADQSGHPDPLYKGRGAEISPLLVGACRANALKVAEEKSDVDQQIETLATNLRFAGFGLMTFKTGPKG